jgi:23S rRNA (adenine2030-N6)-methyltransferase
VNYRHAFHAGNFADVFKHVVLTLLFQALRRKETPFCYLETHAGAGRYDLGGEAAQKSGEYRDGIGRLWEWPDPPAELLPYLAAVRAVNRTTTLRFYPGSPRLARHFLRPQDRMMLCELHPEAASLLEAEFAGDRQVRVRVFDGYQGLKAYLPPEERRGLVLIDPPYEREDEFERVLTGLRAAHRRWATGMYTVWYPVKARAPVARFHRELQQSGIRKILLAELLSYPEDTAFRLNGSGMLLVNPPWRLDRVLGELLPRVLARLPHAADGRAEVAWLVPE